MKIQESAENYLETILLLGQAGNRVRSIDIVNALHYTKPSVSVAMRNLRSNGHIRMDAGGWISLTENGRKIAETMYERHVVISNWLVALGVDQTTAVNDACKMEHYISAQSFEAIKRHLVSGEADGRGNIRVSAGEKNYSSSP